MRTFTDLFNYDEKHLPCLTQSVASVYTITRYMLLEFYGTIRKVRFWVYRVNL
ncbi:hypothetical protein VCRA219O19_220089 [Vibrio crassostreae]|nr:hypothetical protein VCRA219O19_220089 [Vibrio crassostreae]